MEAMPIILGLLIWGIVSAVQNSREPAHGRTWLRRIRRRARDQYFVESIWGSAFGSWFEGEIPVSDFRHYMHLFPDSLWTDPPSLPHSPRAGRARKALVAWVPYGVVGDRRRRRNQWKLCVIYRNNSTPTVCGTIDWEHAPQFDRWIRQGADGGRFRPQLVTLHIEPGEANQPRVWLTKAPTGFFGRVGASSWSSIPDRATRKHAPRRHADMR